MSDRPQRSLRPRKPFPYLPPDTQDPDLFGYSKLNFNKESAASTNQTNMTAKLLIKYINNANKCIQQYRREQVANQELQVMAEKAVVERSYQKIKNGKQGVEKGRISKKEQKEDQGKKEKQGNLKNIGIVKNIKNDGCKGQKQNQSTNLFRQFGQYAAVINQLSERGSLNFDPNSFNQHIFLQSFPQNNLQPKSHTNIQQWLIDNQNQLFSNKKGSEPKKEREKEREKEEKLFGRSAYHIAIAYHIHLKTIKGKVGENKVNSDHLDPTFYAKKLREQQIQRNQMMQNEV